jgi:hypothetical protein
MAEYSVQTGEQLERDQAPVFPSSKMDDVLQASSHAFRVLLQRCFGEHNEKL